LPHRLPIAHHRSAAATYATSLGLVTIALVVTPLVPSVLQKASFAFFFTAVAVSAALDGFLPGILTALLSALAVAGFLIEPVGAITWDDGVRLSAFLAVSTVIAALGERGLRGSRRERAQREWSDVTLQSIGDAVMVTDAQGCVLSMNRVAETLTGWRSAEAVGRPLHTVFRIVEQETREPIEDPASRVRVAGTVVGLANHTILIGRDGTETPIDDSGAPIWSDDGELVGVVLVFRDVADRRAAEREMAAILDREQLARHEAESANRAKDEFLATLSHELRTPLNAMLGWTQLLRERPSEDVELKHGLEIVERNVRRLARLIDDVLDVSRIVAGKLRLELEPVEIAGVIDAAVEVIRPDAERKRIDLHIHAAPDLTVLGDPLRLQQVLLNLLSNAVKFSPKASAIDVTARPDDSSVEIVVRDQGAGISADFLPFLFDRFRQEDSTSRRAHGGLGLGLAVVRHLVEMHGGRVEARSPGPGKGATFVVRLPLHHAGAVVAQRRIAAPSAIQRPSLMGARIVAVDDDPDARDLLERMLRKAGAEVQTASSADEAIALVRASTPDVLVSDLEMPDQDGFALVRRLREEGFADLPAVALTAYATAEHRIRALDAGFQLHVAKPLGQRELELVVAAAARWRPPAS